MLGDFDYEYDSFHSSQHSEYSVRLRDEQMNIDDDNDDDNNTNYDNDNDNDNTNDDDDDVNDDDDNDDNDEDEDEDVVTRPHKHTSNVWEHIDKETDPVNPKCKLCNKIFSKHSSTSTLRNHLKSKHKTIYKEAGQTTLDFLKVSFYDKKTNSAIVKFLVKWIVIDMLPFSLVESSYFKDFLEKLNPKFQCPSRFALKDSIISEFNIRRSHIISFIKNIPGYCSFTTDIWSSINNDAFIGVTIHYITNEWELKHFTLEVFKITGSHTGSAIYEFLSNLLEEFDIKKKIISITTDNGSNIVAACNLLKNDFDSYSDMPNFVHCRCICHILNLAVNVGIKEEENLIKKLRKIVKHIRKTQSCLEELKRLAIASNKGFKRPILDVKTRWNSTFYMIQRALELQDDLYTVKSLNKSISDIWLTQNEWKKIKVSIYYILSDLLIL